SPAPPWEIGSGNLGLGGGHALGKGHAEVEVDVLELALDLAEGGPAEGAELEEIGIGLADELGDGLDAGGLEAVAGANGELELADGHVELADELFIHAGGGGGFLADSLGAELEVLDEGIEVLAEDLGRLDEGHLGGDGAVGPDLEGEL